VSAPYNPIIKCKCGREFAYVNGYSESRQVCGICLALDNRPGNADTVVKGKGPKKETA